MQASGQVLDNTVLFGISTPVALAVLVFFVYSLIVFREREPESALEGPAVRGHAGAQMWWLVVTTTSCCSWPGTPPTACSSTAPAAVRDRTRSPSPVTSSTGPALQVQVIAQQWAFTYRFPGYGGVETPHLELPANRLVEFHVTSLDVIHSFWAYQLAVKADANPGVDNVAFVKTRGPLSFNIHCAELCGVWHGYMFDTGRVVPGPDFAAWITQQQRQFAPVRKSLPPYSRTYFPDPQRRGG